MKKIGVVIIFLIFIGFAFLGFKAASKILPATRSVSNNKANNPTAITQQNYLIFRVDDLSANEPALISIWAALIYPSTPPQIIVLPLFPSTNQEIHERLADKFALNHHGEVVPTFLRLVSREYDLQTNGYILADQTALGQSILWMTGQETSATSAPALSEDEKTALIANGQNVYQQFCQMLVAGSGSGYYAAINWSALLPDHFVTNLSFDELIIQAEKILRVGPLGQCNVIAPQ